MNLERHLFVPDPEEPAECRVCGRPTDAHPETLPEKPGKKRAAVHRKPTDTEAAAAALVTPALNRLQQQVLDALHTAPAGLTVEELVESWDWPPYKRTTVGPRCSELARAGLIEDSGERRQGPNQGSPSIVWRVVLTPADRW